MNTAEKCAAPDGVLLIDKPAGMTSHDVVSRVRRLFGTRQVGHTGTLDPMATGVLILLLGRAAKASEYVSHDEKSYEAVLRLGLRTDTEDTTGVILSTAPAVSLPDGAALDAVLTRFHGKIFQIPHMYSALKVGGRKLCDIARAGGTVERQPRPVEIRALTAEPASLPSDFRLHVTCSGGTYIRTLCADIGDALACGGTMAALRRTAASGYPVSACRTQARSVDRAMDSGRVSRSFCRVARNRCMCREPGRPYSVTQWPVRSRYQAISEPQRPHPITVICIKIPPVA